MQTNQQFIGRVKDLCKERDVPLKKLIEDGGFAASFVYNIEKRDKTPSIKVLDFIAGYFDVSVDYLLGKTDTPAQKTELLDGLEYAFLDGYRQLDDEDRAELNRAAQRMLELKQFRESQPQP